MTIVSRMRRPPRGMTVVAILVCLVVITLIGGAVLKVGLAHRALIRSQEHQLQAEWLAESGVQRALARLAVEREYGGESWSISAADLGLPEQPPTTGTAEKSHRSAAVVTIAIERVPGGAARRWVRVQADYPRDAPQRSRHTKQVMIDLDRIEK
jgi:Tfp pilus assembly protein PilX